MKKKDGKPLERLVKLIHECLNDNPNTMITSNYKIESLPKVKREIDLLIESQINGINIKIALECKDYSRAVGIEKMDAFRGKCESIPDISKKVFVSKSGYTSGAIQYAKAYSIDLYEVGDLSKDLILSWFPRIAKLKLDLQIMQVMYGLDPEVYNDDSLEIGSQVFVNEELICDDIDTLVKDEVVKKREQLGYITTVEFMRQKELVLNQGIDLPLKLVPPTDAYVLGENQKKIELKELLVIVRCRFVESDAEIIEASAYGEYQNEEKQVRRLSVDMGHDIHADVLRVKDGEFQIFVKDGGETIQLKDLGVYDPKTDTYTPSKD